VCADEKAAALDVKQLAGGFYFLQVVGDAVELEVRKKKQYWVRRAQIGYQTQ